MTTAGGPATKAGGPVTTAVCPARTTVDLVMKVDAVGAQLAVRMADGCLAQTAGGCRSDCRHEDHAAQVAASGLSRGRGPVDPSPRAARVAAREPSLRSFLVPGLATGHAPCLATSRLQHQHASHRSVVASRVSGPSPSHENSRGRRGEEGWASANASSSGSATALGEAGVENSHVHVLRQANEAREVHVA